MVTRTGAALARKTSHRFGHGLIALVALWPLIAALVFSGSLLTWFVSGDAIAVGVLALADLAWHEASTERVVHSLRCGTCQPAGRRMTALHRLLTP